MLCSPHNEHEYFLEMMFFLCRTLNHPSNINNSLFREIRCKVVVREQVIRPADEDNL